MNLSHPRTFLTRRGFDDALLLSWSLDPVFFETMHLPLLRDGRAARVLVLADQSQLDARWPQLVDQVRAGRVRELGRGYGAEGVSVERHFHAKLWLRTSDKGGMVLVGSGNLTGMGWSGQRELASGWEVGPDHADRGGWLRPLLQDLAARVGGRGARDQLARVLGLPWIPASPAPAPPVLWSGRVALSTQLAERWSGRRFQRLVMLTGSTDDRGAMLKWAHDAFGVTEATVILTPDRAAFLPARLASLPLTVRIAPFSDGRRPLHAKLLWLEGPDGPAVAFGSANCSASAWLPARGGPPSFELVAVIDHPDPNAFEDLLLDRLQAADPQDVLPERKPVDPTPPPPSDGGLRLLFAEYDRARREVRVGLSPDPEEGARVCLRGGDHAWALTPSDGCWTGAVGELEWPALVHVEVVRGSGAECSSGLWLTDVFGLRDGARQRAWRGALEGLRLEGDADGQRSAVQDLRRLSAALFQVAGAPTERRGTARAKPSSSRSAPPLDPARLASVHLEGLVGEFQPYLLRQGLSITGILRAIFQVAPPSEDPEPGDEPPGDRGAGSAIALHPDQVKRLARALDQHLGKMEEEAWIQGCSPKQLADAAAFPLALALLGLESEWLPMELAGVWIRGVLERIRPGGPLARAWQRLRTEPGAEVEALLGDGQLLSTALVATAVTAWESPLLLALQLVAVCESEPLICLVQGLELVSRLIAAIRVTEVHRRQVDEGLRVVERLRALEEELVRVWPRPGQRSVDWFRAGEVVFLQRRRRWGRVCEEAFVKRDPRLVVEWLDGRGGDGRCRVQRPGEVLVVNLHGWIRAGGSLPAAEFLGLREQPAGPRERRPGGAGLSW